MGVERGGGARFLFVLPELERYNPRDGGAIATVTRELAGALIESGAEVGVLSPRFDGPAYDGVPLRVLPTSGAPRSRMAHLVRSTMARSRSPRWSWRSRYLREVADAVGADPGRVVVVSNDEEAAAMLADDARNRVVLWLHNFLSTAELGRVAALPPSVHIVVISEAVRSWTLEHTGLPPERITVVHNGIDGRRFHPDAGSRIPSAGLSVVCSTRIDPGKGQLLAAEAVRRLHDDGLTDVRLTIQGGPKTFGIPREITDRYLEDLRAAVDAVGGTITGLLPATEVAERLRTFDVALVVPTVRDAFPINGLEALASGCAVVATRLGGVEEMMGDAAILVEPTAESVAAALRRLHDDPDALADYRRRARARSEEFSWAKAAEALRRLEERGRGVQ